MPAKREVYKIRKLSKLSVSGYAEWDGGGNTVEDIIQGSTVLVQFVIKIEQ